ncbi:MAG: CpaF family protein [Acidimicrobiales bacterium]|jgi:pilus assembly protein CpaF
MSLSARLRQVAMPAVAPEVVASVVAEPEPSAAKVASPEPFRALRLRAHTELFARLGSRLYDPDLDEDGLRVLVLAELTEVLAAEVTPLSSDERVSLVKAITADVLGHGPIEPLLEDPEVSEIMVNGRNRVYVERSGRLHATDVRYLSDEHLRQVIDRIVARVGRRIDESSPMVDARLPDGSRVNAVIPPLAVDGPSLTIRKFAAKALTVDDLVAYGSLTEATAQFLQACVHGKLNILVSGGTGTGKTTLLNVVSSFIPADERVVTIEDAVELRLSQDHVVRLESRPANVEGRGSVSIRDLMRNALRMRPDRIIVGEVRGGEALDMLQAMNTGHEGSLSTLHANTPRDAVSRLETMVLMGGLDLPMRAIREQIGSAIDLFVQISRLRDGSRKITYITEVEGLEGEIVTLTDLFVFDHSAGVDAEGKSLGSLVPTGIRPRCTERLEDEGVFLPASMFEPEGAGPGGW